MNDPQKAIKLVEIAIKKYEEEKEKNKIDEDSDEFKDSKSIIEVMKENLNSWKD